MQSDCINGSPACSAPTKTQETWTASEVSTHEDILLRTRAHAPANDDLLHGRARLCRSCGAETTNDCICDACAEALRVERAEAQSDLCRRYGVTCIEAVPRAALVEHQRAWGRC